jgi:hypothetical protein
MLVVWKSAKIAMVRRIVPSNPQRSIYILPMVRVKIAVKRVVLLDVKLTIASKNCLYLDKIKALTALEVQDFKALDKLILERF